MEDRSPFLVFGFLLLFVALPAVVAQNIEQNFADRSAQGLPFIRNYSPKEYKSHHQNWAIVQGPDGRMIFANGNGILIFDNEHWTLLPLPNYDHARSLALAPDSTIYVGGNGELGYLQQNPYGQYEYVSLKAELPPEEQNFTRVWTIIALEDKVYFQTYERLFIWNGKKFSVHRFDHRLHRIFWVNHQLYGSLDSAGLVLWQQDRFTEIPFGEVFANRLIDVLLPFEDNILLAGIREGELYLYHPGGVERFITEGDDLLKEGGIYKGCYLNEHEIALGSWGLIVINKKGKLVRVINTTHNLQNDNILNVFPDQYGDLWLGLQIGISKIDFGSSVNLINEQLGVEGSVRFITQSKNKLLAVTLDGLFIESNASHGSTAFRHLILEKGDQVLAVNALQEAILLGTNFGLYSWENEEIEVLNHYGSCFFMAPSRFSDQVWAVSDGGMVLLSYQEGKWTEAGKLLGLTGAVRNLVESKPNEIWLGTRASGIYRVRYPLLPDAQLDFSKPQISQFGKDQGLPPGDILPYIIQDSLYIWNQRNREVYLWNEKSETFTRQDNFGERFGITQHKVIPWTSENNAGEVWLKLQDLQTGRVQAAKATRQSKGVYQVKIYPTATDLYAFEDCIYPLDHEVWYGGQDGILHHNLLKKENPYSILPARLTTIQYNQHLLPLMQGSSLIPYQKNAVLRFDFSAPYYPVTGDVKYQYKLSGFDEHWSAWQTEPYKDYTNLWEGEYRFMVKALHPSGLISEVTSFPINITPPWYRNHWTYLLYVLLLGSLVFAYVRFRSLQLWKKNKQLEAIVEERTQEVRAQAEQLKIQTEQLKEIDEFKSRFFANISHEFRTPLTLISGPVETLLFQNNDPKARQQLQLIQRNSRQLLKLVNQLLDLSKIEANQLRLKVSLGNLLEDVRLITMEFESAALTKGLQLMFRAENDQLWLYYERDKLEKIVGNLIANAIKFTQEGQVAVTVKKIKHLEKDYGEIEVKDTGIGIAHAHLSHVFDRFYQADTSTTRHYEGTGIGLSLAKELVSLHGGEIKVESEWGEGSTFKVLLPFGKEHLNEQDVVLPPTPVEPAARETEILADAPILTEKAFENDDKPMLLIVEDNADVRTYLHTQLHESYKVIEAENGKKGFEKAMELVPDLIISDVMMPSMDMPSMDMPSMQLPLGEMSSMDMPGGPAPLGHISEMDGYEFCRKIKQDERTNHIPIIMLTARSSMENKLQGLETGVDDYLTKPFTPAELLLKVRNLIFTRQTLREKYSQEILLQPTEITVSSQQQHFLERLRNIIEQNMAEETFGVEELCREAGMSRTQMNRKLKALLNQTPSDLIRTFRLQRAAELIRKDAGNMAEIAYQVGFSSQSYFTRAFQEAFHCSPLEYKRRKEGA